MELTATGFVLDFDTSISAAGLTCARFYGARAVGISGVSLEFEPASLNILFGDEESGKDLLFKLLALMDVPDEGEIRVAGESTREWSEIKRGEVRTEKFGFVFEAPFLLPSFSIVENVAMPLFKLTGLPPEEARTHTTSALTLVGLGDYCEYLPEQLPVWAQLRVSLARAIVTQPMVLFVENLDKELRDDELVLFLELLAVVRKALGCCVVVTAASRDVAAYGTRAVELISGRIARQWKPGGLLS